MPMARATTEFNNSFYSIAMNKEMRKKNKRKMETEYKTIPQHIHYGWWNDFKTRPE